MSEYFKSILLKGENIPKENRVSTTIVVEGFEVGNLNLHQIFQKKSGQYK
jgi:hypothetical protein